MSRRTTRILSTAGTVLLLLLLWWVQSQGEDDPSAQDRSSPTASSTPTPSEQPPKHLPARDDDGFRYVSVDQLPPEAAATLELIDEGGPYPHPGKDGSTFGNFEGVLPDRQRGYYAEYTVETPGLSHRGARRIIAGDGGEFYWTGDHYESFERIRR
ncbi:MAG: ribonuclease [Propionibacteriales bacterium]|nr:ribonuclease [Propionibacteriales bacterium]